MSEMYRKEVPLYGELVRIVREVDNLVLKAQGKNTTDLPARHHLERHGAIRLGLAYELWAITRLFSLLGMHPVGYYDLGIVGFPLHATAFRPISEEALKKNPFRVFVSVLRRDLIPADIQADIDDILRKRRLFSLQLLKLMDRAEAKEGMSARDADELIVESLKIFEWNSRSTVPIEDYLRLKKKHPVIADIVCFPSAHINHLTPRTINIDLVQEEMVKQGLPAKERIEGPPNRRAPILLRQTSFKALEERVEFLSADGEPVPGTHTARFGEVEQRGAAVTPSGRALYDKLLAEAHQLAADGSRDIDDALKESFSAYPDSWSELRKLGLVYFRYTPHERRRHHAADKVEGGRAKLEDLVDDESVEFEPIIYEDFLPLSAAGIFTSNLGGSNVRATDSKEDDGDLSQFEEALGCEVRDPFTLYRGLQERSIDECAKVLCLDSID